MRRLALALLAGTLIAVAGCASTVSNANPASQSSPPFQTPTASPSPESTPSADSSTVQVIDAYDLYTHCGIRQAKIGDAFYRAAPPLDDGNGNPPDGWGNPSQRGTMTVYNDGTARFTEGSLVATFVLRKGATEFLGPPCS